MGKPSSTGLIVEGQAVKEAALIMANLKLMEPQEPYNTKEDLLELAQEYKETKQNQEKDKWKLARLAQEAAQKFDLKQFAKETGENYQTLKDLSHIAGKYTPEEVSSSGTTLEFKHFIVAAKADNRLEWLGKAQNNAWSAERLRREMNPPKPVEKKEPVPECKIEPNPLPVRSWAPSEPEVWRPSYDEALEIMNGWEFSEEGEMLLRAYGVHMFAMLKAIWDDPRTIFRENGRFVFRIIKPPIEDGIEVGTKEGPSQ